MLVLSRRPEQSLILGDDVTITILAIEGDRVKLGIQAPRSVSVLRYELYLQIQAANAEAGTASRPSSSQVAAALRGRAAGSATTPVA